MYAGATDQNYNLSMRAEDSYYFNTNSELHKKVPLWKQGDFIMFTSKTLTIKPYPMKI